MGRRYYCDYCEKSFIDDIDARKKHLSGLAHQQAKNQHYYPFRDPKEILEDESKKTECRKFLKGTCVFGINCNYSHYSLYELNELKRQVEENDRFERERKYQQEYIDSDIASLDDWLKKRRQNLANNSRQQTTSVEDQISWSYPEHLEQRPDLPPSLIKFQAHHFVDAKFSTWG